MFGAISLLVKGKFAISFIAQFCPHLTLTFWKLQIAFFSAIYVNSKWFLIVEDPKYSSLYLNGMEGYLNYIYIFSAINPFILQLQFLTVYQYSDMVFDYKYVLM